MATVTYEKSVVARASIIKRTSGSFSAEAVLIAAATISSPGLQSGWPGDDFAMPGNILLGAIPYGAFTADAVIKTTYTGVFSAEALIAKLTGQQFTFTAEAAIAVASGNWLETTLNTVDNSEDVVCSMSDTNVVTLSVEREDTIVPNTWTTIYTTSGRNAFFFDKTPPLNYEFRYRGRGYDVNGVLIQSITSYPIIITTASDEGGWSITDGFDTVNLVVTSSSAQRELQTEVFSPLGSTFKIVQVGNQLGRKGSIEFFVSNEERQSLLASVDKVINSTRQTYLRTPFGLVLPVVFGGMSETLLAGGHSKIVLEYIENGAS